MYNSCTERKRYTADSSLARMALRSAVQCITLAPFTSMGKPRQWHSVSARLASSVRSASTPPCNTDTNEKRLSTSRRANWVERKNRIAENMSVPRSSY